jgi:hypothetical protein
MTKANSLSLRELGEMMSILPSNINLSRAGRVPIHARSSLPLLIMPIGLLVTRLSRGYSVRCATEQICPSGPIKLGAWPV